MTRKQEKENLDDTLYNMLLDNDLFIQLADPRAGVRYAIAKRELGQTKLLTGFMVYERMLGYIDGIVDERNNKLKKL